MSVYRVGSNKSSNNVFPSVRPTLDLDFANSKTLDPRITFTRASGGSYVGADGLIKYAGVNEARFDHDPVTGESLGLLIEESRQNLLTYSEDFGSGSWSKLNCSANTTNILSPSGSQSTNIFVPDQMQSNNLIAIVRNGVPVVSNNTYTLSLYIKNGGYNNLVLFVDNIKSSGPARTGALYRMTGTSGVSFSSSNLNTANVDTTHSIQKINNDWYKIFLTFPVETNSIGVNFRFTNNGVGYINTNGDGTSGIYIWGAQLEQGAFPTSYIPTLGSTRTRALDSALITGKNFTDFYNPNEFTMKTTFSRFSNNTPPYMLAISSSTIFNSYLPSIRIRTDGNRNVQGQAVSKENTVVYNSNVFTFLNINQPCNAAIAVKSGDTVYSDSGKLAPISNLRGSFDTATTLHIGGTGGTRGNGHVKNVVVYSKRLPNEQLIALTR
jgi:hypothetical protein